MNQEEFLKKFKIIKGRKSEKDRIILYNGKAVSFEDVAQLCIFFMENEDNLYPPPRFKGAQMFIDYMTEVLETRKIPKNSRYQIKKKLVKLK
tara:strand:+ start:806 stop:1081 length:276 start_codon:yes stop_codon:yes gene_type:complete